MRIKSAVFSRLVLSSAVLFFVFGLFFVFSFSPSIQTTKACPPPPSALRELIMNSDRIVVATVSGSTVVKVERENESGKSVMLRIALNVSDTLKGSSVEPLVHVHRYAFISYTDGQETVRVLQGEFEVGKKLLLFLRKSNENGQEGYFLTDYSQGMKDLSDDELDVYVKRINEFVEIMKDKQPDKNKIVEWLVRCAEEPATRWEGAYDLSRNFSIMRYEEAEKAQKKDEKSNEESNEESEETETTDETEINGEDEVQIEELSTASRDFAIYDSELPKLLTDSQKERLANALFNTEKLSDGDHALISLVKNWQGKKVAAFLLPKLRQLAVEDSGTVSYFMELIADIVEDKELTKLAEMYSGIAYSDDDEIIDMNELASDAQEDQSTVELQGEEIEETASEIEEASETDVPSAEEQKTEVQKTGFTATQVRSNLMERFINLCESLLVRE